VRFALPNEVFDDSRASSDHLDRLLHRVAEEVHTIGLVDAEHVERTPWFVGLRAHLQELVRSAVVAATFAPAAKHVHVGKDLSLNAAVRLAYTPLVVAVENREFDGMLVDAAIRAFGSREAQRLWAATPSTGVAVILDHGGGTGDQLKQIQRLIEQAQ
jgi:hypothetical protein